MGRVDAFQELTAITARQAMRLNVELNGNVCCVTKTEHGPRPKVHAPFQTVCLDIYFHDHRPLSVFNLHHFLCCGQDGAIDEKGREYLSEFVGNRHRWARLLAFVWVSTLWLVVSRCRALGCNCERLDVPELSQECVLIVVTNHWMRFILAYLSGRLRRRAGTFCDRSASLNRVALRWELSEGQGTQTPSLAPRAPPSRLKPGME